ncbi:MAG TPA: hypothetical protein VLA52_12415 [Thermohalobaculum sp.]|nr:hypothetical protein [Thermohalobaculum sp.]
MSTILIPVARFLAQTQSIVSALIFAALFGATLIAAPVAAQNESAQGGAEAFFGSWKGRWYTNGRSGSAEWAISRKEDGSIHLSANIYTPGGPVDYTLAPIFNSETGALDVNDDASGTTGTIVIDGMKLRFDYHRHGRDGHYSMKRKS